MEPLDRSTIWPYRNGEPGDHYYQRNSHPTGVAAERALGELEGGEALLVSEHGRPAGILTRADLLEALAR